MSFNTLKCFSALVKISPCGKFKKFKANKAVLTIVIGLKSILRWNLLGSFNGLEPGGPESAIRKRKRERKTRAPKL